MKRLLLWLFGFAIIGLFGQVFAVETYINNKAVYLNVYDLSKDFPNIKPAIKINNWEYRLYYNLNIKNVYNYLKFSWNNLIVDAKYVGDSYYYYRMHFNRGLPIDISKTLKQNK